MPEFLLMVSIVSNQIKKKIKIAGPYSSLYRGPLSCLGNVRNHFTTCMWSIEWSTRVTRHLSVYRGPRGSCPMGISAGAVCTGSVIAVSNFCLRKWAVSLFYSEKRLFPMHIQHRKHILFSSCHSLCWGSIQPTYICTEREQATKMPVSTLQSPLLQKVFSSVTSSPVGTNNTIDT